jgi:hypothetical protein
MVDSIREYGIIKPIIVNQDGRVIDGRLRLKIHEMLMSEESPDDPAGYPRRFGNKPIPTEKKTLGTREISNLVSLVNNLRSHLSDAQRTLAVANQEKVIDDYYERTGKEKPASAPKPKPAKTEPTKPSVQLDLFGEASSPNAYQTWSPR